MEKSELNICAHGVRLLLATKRGYVLSFLTFRSDRQQQLPASSVLGEGAAELRGSKRGFFSKKCFKVKCTRAE